MEEIWRIWRILGLLISALLQTVAKILAEGVDLEKCEQFLIEFMELPAKNSKLSETVKRNFEDFCILCVDIGATRTKFLLAQGAQHEIVLPPLETSLLWKLCDFAQIRANLSEHLKKHGVERNFVDHLMISVPGTLQVNRKQRNN